MGSREGSDRMKAIGTGMPLEPSVRHTQFINENPVARRRNTEVTWDADRREVVLRCWYNEVTKAELSAAWREARRRHGKVRAVVVYCAQEVYAEQFMFFEKMKFTRDICREQQDMFCLVRRLEEK
jgi:hypothetical protein